MIKANIYSFQISEAKRSDFPKIVLLGFFFPIETLEEVKPATPEKPAFKIGTSQG
jgi:hypothetical protein